MVVEFAILCPIFVVLLCAVIENGLILFTQTLMDNGTRDAARIIMLGNATSQSFTDAFCKTACGLVPRNSLQINVVSGATFAGLNSTLQTDSNGNMVNTQFNPGTAGQAVLVRVGYNRQFMIPLFGTFSGAKSELLVSTVTLKSEPYSQ